MSLLELPFYGENSQHRFKPREGYSCDIYWRALDTSQAYSLTTSTNG